MDDLLSSAWQEALPSYSRLVVGFSGGLDSTVLLHVLATQPLLVSKLQAVHVHHGLSRHATDWQIHCEHVCATWRVPLIVRHVMLADKACHIEEQARAARYQVFSELLAEGDGLLLAHHEDDQAETLLLQLVRGAGVDGLAAMMDSRALAKGTLLRPFLTNSRDTLIKYAKQHGLAWIEDESNQNTTFSRNYLRHDILPRLQLKWPGVMSNLARSAKNCQQACSNLQSLAMQDYPLLKQAGLMLNLTTLRQLESARLANVLRYWFKLNQIRSPSVSVFNRLVQDVIFSDVDATPSLHWGGYTIRRYQDVLYLMHDEFTQPFQRTSTLWVDFPNPLPLLSPDGTTLYLCASPSSNGVCLRQGGRLEVRFRQGGETFHWHGQTKRLKKLFQQWQIPIWHRDSIPLLYLDDQLVAVVGFAISETYQGVGYSLHLKSL